MMKANAAGRLSVNEIYEIYEFISTLAVLTEAH